MQPASPDAVGAPAPAVRPNPHSNYAALGAALADLRFPVQPFVVFDCEMSGTRASTHGPDWLFGFSVVAGYLHPETGAPTINLCMSVGIEPPFMALYAKPSNVSAWKHWWTELGWCQDTFLWWTGFYEPRGDGTSSADRYKAGGARDELPGHLPQLDALLTPALDGPFKNFVAASRAEAASLLDLFLATIEARSPTGFYTLGVDTISTEPWLLADLLVSTERSRFPLSHRRDGVYRAGGSLDVDSMLRANAHLYGERGAALSAELYATAERAAPIALAAHHPQWDGHVLMHVVLSAIARFRAAQA